MTRSGTSSEPAPPDLDRPGPAVTRAAPHRPGHAAPPDERADRIAAAGTGLLVLAGAIITYLAVVSGIDPLLAPSPAGGAPPVVVRSVTPTPSATPPATAGPPVIAAPPEPTTPRARPRVTTPAPPQPSVPSPTPTTPPPPTSTGPPPSPTASPSG